ncbi:Essential recombination function protein [uncultured Caudovirales phage]|uniref:Essential recombination function protein n=1 Tax=uncultured Caudovirales phage TaxID=2100421 RepID=A0A6J5MHA8_9CAUD|nr:Essential recombination function protein [uncultured Caudovirales phage]
MSIYDDLFEIQANLKVDKENNNKFGKFKYFSVQDILTKFKALEVTKKKKLTIGFKDDVVQIGIRFYINETITLRNGDGETIEHSIKIREPKKKAQMDESQTTGSAITYARKYGLAGLFAIDAEDKDDPDAQEPATEAKTTKPTKGQQQITF